MSASRGSARWPREAPARPSPRRTPPFPLPPARPCCSEIRCRQRTASRTGPELATGATRAKPVPMIASRSPGSRHCSGRSPATIRPACRRKLPRPARTERCRPAHPALRLRTTPPSACPRCWVAPGSLPSSTRTASTARPAGCAWRWNGRLEAPVIGRLLELFEGPAAPASWSPPSVPAAGRCRTRGRSAGRCRMDGRPRTGRSAIPGANAPGQAIDGAGTVCLPCVGVFTNPVDLQRGRGAHVRRTGEISPGVIGTVENTCRRN